MIAAFPLNTEPPDATSRRCFPLTGKLSIQINTYIQSLLGVNIPAQPSEPTPQLKQPNEAIGGAVSSGSPSDTKERMCS